MEVYEWKLFFFHGKYYHTKNDVCNSFKVRFSSEIKGKMKNQHRRDEKSVSKYHGV